MKTKKLIKEALKSKFILDRINLDRDHAGNWICTVERFKLTSSRRQEQFADPIKFFCIVNEDKVSFIKL